MRSSTVVRQQVRGWVKRKSLQLGLDIGHAKNTLSRVRYAWLSELGVRLVIDGGANRGQYARALMEHGYDGRIVSFEPIPHVFEELSAQTTGYRGWMPVGAALGNFDGTVRMHVAKSDTSSSILVSEPLQEIVAPGAMQIYEIDVRMCRLDSFRSSRPDLFDGPFLLKLDLQGYEVEALLGASEAMAECVLVECELSFDEVYSDQPLVEDVISHLAREGFRPVWMERGFTDHRRRRILQVDALFARKLNT